MARFVYRYESPLQSYENNVDRCDSSIIFITNQKQHQRISHHVCITRAPARHGMCYPSAAVYMAVAVVAKVPAAVVEAACAMRNVLA